jgi:UDP-N-acetylmuramoyl-tripeptide--D-alanyl-D-alanine ligase
VTVIRVADPIAALGCDRRRLARRFEPLVVGVTGEHRQDLDQGGRRGCPGPPLPDLAQRGNQNNEVGLPLTLMRLGPEHEAAVLEMGMYTGGEIADLARLARPRIGVVTAVQPVHLSRIGSIEAIEAGQGRAARGTPRRRRRDPECRRPDRPPHGRALRGTQHQLRVRGRC